MNKTTEEEPENVIKGPWKNKSKRDVILPEEDIIEMQDNLMFMDNLTEALMVQMIHTIRENAIDVEGEDFLQDMSFIIECVRSTLYREMGTVHPMSKIMEAFTTDGLDTKYHDLPSIEFDDEKDPA
jgi:hypothetical protein|tara:strand:+ start:441 stop:818 length:378 start_codon:yes stop_codon:yes gene_type:complete